MRLALLCLLLAARAAGLSVATAASLKKQLLAQPALSTSTDPVLATPVSLSPLTINRRVLRGAASIVAVAEDGSSYASEGFLDLVAKTDADAAGSLRRALLPPLLGGGGVQSDTFRGPVIPWLYERGWRAAFAASGFPGAEVETDEANEHFRQCESLGGVLVDMSCGSGLATRRFTASQLHRRVIAADYSEDMLRQASDRHPAADRPDFVRADVGQLPFGTGSVDSMHAGAALHCWPDLEASLLECRRALRSGGGYYATTFLTDPARGRPVARSAASAFRWFELDELERLHREAGFTEVEVRRVEPSCAVVRARA